MMQSIRQIITQDYGLQPDTVGGQSIEHAVHKRMERIGVHAEHQYAALLRSSLEERRALIDALVVPETWFFRDASVFEYLQSVARDEWLRTDPPQPVRGLSAGCCTGEEPYSIVMALLDVGFAPGRIHIDACDISEPLIQQAKQGVYGGRSFRAEELSYRKRYFTPVEQGYQISRTVRERVRFYVDNIIEPAMNWVNQQYDLIFCRNVLIYLNQSARDKVLENIERILKPGGLLFLGASETLQVKSPVFERVKVSGAFAHRKRTDIPVDEMPEWSEFSNRFHNRLQWQPEPPPTRQADRGAATKAQAVIPEQATRQGFQEEFAKAREAADHGRLDQAFAFCQSLTREYGPRTETYMLQGLMHQSRNEMPEAIENYQKALYLEPHHYETLIHISYLLKRLGDEQQAERYRKRADRVKPGPTME